MMPYRGRPQYEQAGSGMAQRDTIRQNLTPKQLRALDLYLVGKRDEQVARAVGVSRQTVNSWRNHDQRFIDELRCRQNEMTRTLRDQQRALAWKAMDVVTKALDEGDAKTALEIGKLLGLFSPVPLPEGPETIEQLEQHRAALRRIAGQVESESEQDRERRAHRQARAEAEQAYTDKLIEEMTPIDQEVYRRRLAEILAQETRNEAS